MFAVSSSKTMANARFKVSNPQREMEPVAKRELPAVVMMRSEVLEMERIAARRKLAAMEAEQAMKVLQRFSYGAQNQRIALIMARICKVMGIHPQEILSERRHRQIVKARHAIMYWATRQTRFSMPQIGQRLGGRDHTTILHGVAAHRKRRAADGRYLRPAR
ncbi:putative chromosomal replication initiator protein DnaA [Microcystis phage Mae-JY35]